jgi:hypothetical protein
MQRDGTGNNGVSGSNIHRYPINGQTLGVMPAGLSESPSALSFSTINPLDVSQGSLTSRDLFGSLNLVRPLQPYSLKHKTISCIYRLHLTISSVSML